MGILGRLLAAGRPRLFEVERRIAGRLGVPLPPVAVQWITTRACDLACDHCYSEAGRRLDGELDAAEAGSLILDEMVKLGSPMLVLAGGEPLLRDDLSIVLERAASLGIAWSMHTHGGWVLRRRAWFEAHPPAMVAVSLDGPRELHDRIRGRVGSFDRALEAIRMLRDLGVREVIAGTTVRRDNADHLGDLEPIVRESGAHGWGLHLVTPEGRAGSRAELRPTAGQIRRTARLAHVLRARFKVDLDNEWGSAGRLDPLYRDGDFFCGAGRSTCVVGATGEVFPCTTTDLKESAGNIRHRSLVDIWNQGFAAFRGPEDPLRGDCRDCWLQTRHGSSCRVDAFAPSAPDAADRRPARDWEVVS